MAGRNAEYDKKIRTIRQARGLCYRCGGITDGIHKSCDACREKIRENNHRYKERYGYQYGKKVSDSDEKMLEEVKPKRKQKKYEIDELNRMAKEKGLSYGVFVALMEQKI